MARASIEENPSVCIHYNRDDQLLAVFFSGACGCCSLFSPCEHILYPDGIYFEGSWLSQWKIPKCSTQTWLCLLSRCAVTCTLSLQGIAFSMDLRHFISALYSFHLYLRLCIHCPRSWVCQVLLVFFGILWIPNRGMRLVLEWVRLSTSVCEWKLSWIGVDICVGTLVLERSFLLHWVYHTHFIITSHVGFENS